MNKYDATLDVIDKLEKKLRNIQMLDEPIEVEYAGTAVNIHVCEFLHSLYHTIKKLDRHTNKVIT